MFIQCILQVLKGNIKMKHYIAYFFISLHGVSQVFGTPIYTLLTLNPSCVIAVLVFSF